MESVRVCESAGLCVCVCVCTVARFCIGWFYTYYSFLILYYLPFQFSLLEQRFDINFCLSLSLYSIPLFRFAYHFHFESSSNRLHTDIPGPYRYVFPHLSNQTHDVWAYIRESKIWMNPNVRIIEILSDGNECCTGANVMRRFTVKWKVKYWKES